VLERPVLSFMELLPHLIWALTLWNQSSQLSVPFMVASVDVLAPVKAARNFEGYDGDVMRPGSTPLVLCAVRLHCHVSLPQIHGSGAKLRPGCARILDNNRTSEKNDER
jgi:hypothetical protein